MVKFEGKTYKSKTLKINFVTKNYKRSEKINKIKTNLPSQCLAFIILQVELIKSSSIEISKKKGCSS